MFARSKCHPAADGRLPQTGDEEYVVKIELEDDRELILELGPAARDKLVDALKLTAANRRYPPVTRAEALYLQAQPLAYFGQ